MSQTAQSVVKGVEKVTTIIDNLIADLVSLDNPTVAAAVVAYILQVSGGAGSLGISETTLLAIVGGIGVAATFIKGLFTPKTSARK